MPQPQVLQLRIEQLPAACLRCEQDRQSTVLQRIDGLDGVHDHDQTHTARHAHSPEDPGRPEYRVKFNARGRGRRIGRVPQTVNHATVVYPRLPRNVDPITWLARPGYVKKPQDSSTYARRFTSSRSVPWRA